MRRIQTCEAQSVLIQAEQKTELPPRAVFQVGNQNPARRSTASMMRNIADTVKVQRWRGLSANGGTLGSPNW